MSTKPNDGGQAFPGFKSIPGYGCCQPISSPQGEVVFAEFSTGMSLRAYFAGQALPEVMRDAREANMRSLMNHEADKVNCEDVAEACCDYADALIAELEKEKE